MTRIKYFSSSDILQKKNEIRVKEIFGARLFVGCIVSLFKDNTVLELSPMVHHGETDLI